MSRTLSYRYDTNRPFLDQSELAREISSRTRRSARLMTPEDEDYLIESSLALIMDLKYAYRMLPCTVMQPGRLPDNPIRHIVDETTLELSRLVLSARYHHWPTLYVYGVPKRRCDTATQFAVAVGEYYLRVVAAFASGKSQRTRECCKTLKALAVNQYGLYFF